MARIPVIELTAVLEDAEGERSWTSAYILDVSWETSIIEGFLDEWVSVLQAMSNARVVEASYTGRKIYGWGQGVSEPYANSEDKALMIFRDNATGLLYQQKIPAPKLAIFAADRETVDTGTGPMEAYLAWIVGHAVSRGASAGNSDVLKYQRGYLLRGKIRRVIRPGILTEQGG